MHKRVVAIVSTFLCAAGIATPAAAQRYKPEGVYEKRQENHIVGNSFVNELNAIPLTGTDEFHDRYLQARSMVDCIATRRTDAYKLVGESDGDKPDYSKLERALRVEMPQCFNRSAEGIPLAVISGALAEKLLLSRGYKFADKMRPGDLDYAKAFYHAGEPQTLVTVGRCLGVFSPGLVMTALGTTPGTKDEANALETMFAKSPECGVAGAPEGVATMFQRSVIAAGLYDWVRR